MNERFETAFNTQKNPPKTHNKACNLDEINSNVNSHSMN